ncbi:unnamed protein product [Microthlaspi erraticum]|uniref:Reverse transcriptase zinc-binding domain-containing protein n=1 Tax=Microthlaspi erraticum TaxID=1685480 RepID=A0A6D2IZV4_9BRAS|nr:unnamed protein product [Microthlaspi erraticum]
MQGFLSLKDLECAQAKSGKSDLGSFDLVWKRVLSRLDRLQILFQTWEDLMVWMTASSVIAPQILRKFVVQATIFHLWRQRNNILHNQRLIPPDLIFNMLDRDIRNIINSRRRRKGCEILMQLWLR